MRLDSPTAAVHPVSYLSGYVTDVATGEPFSWAFQSLKRPQAPMLKVMRPDFNRILLPVGEHLL